ncbi:MAG: hypothetical protein KC502_17220, partial [Myxococcales bacterium]|nr:hypothetical protein [Myxococcales bacterium]
MSRLLRVCVTTGAVISTLFVSAVALAAPDAALHGPAGVIHAPPDPASAFARRLYHHKSEHHRPGFAADGSQGIHGEAGDQISPFAANFESISDGDWSLKHQDITVSVDPTAAKLSAELTVTVAFHKDGLEDIQFRFGLADTVEVRSEAGELLKAKYTTYFNQMGQLTVTLPEASTATSSMKVRIKYERVMQCNTNKSPLKFCNFDNNIWSVMFYRYYMAHGSAYHAPFTSDLHVITPVGRVAAAPGTPSGPDKLGDDKLIWHFTQKERTANGGFAIGKYSVVGDKDVSAQIAADKPFVRMYVLKNYVFAATSLVGAAKDIISFYGQRFGAFPWAGINITQLAKNFGGGYAPLSGTFMSQNVFGAKVGGQGYTGFTELTAHELAHQWWGNLTAPMGSADVSLSESLAEFSSCYFTEKHLKNRSQIISDNLS